MTRNRKVIASKMPLVVICGLPSSGKTTRAQQLKKYFEDKGRAVVIIDDEMVGEEKNDVYASSIKEKSTRASLKAAVERYRHPA